LFVGVVEGSEDARRAPLRAVCRDNARCIRRRRRGGQ